MILAATALGAGCRVEGPHGPTPCGASNTPLDGSECDCGCTAFEDCCAVYLEWYAERQGLDALAHPKVRTTDTTNETSA